MSHDDQTQQVKQPSKLGAIIIGILGAAMLMFLVYINFLKGDTVQARQEERVNYSGGNQNPVDPPPESPPPKLPQSESRPPVAARPAPAQPVQKSEAQKMREKMHLLAQYDSPLVPFEGEGGRRRASIEDGDLPNERRSSPQTLEVESRYGDRRRGNDGNVWVRDFYERGSGQVGVLQRATSPFVINPGTVIPAKLLRSINTDIPGQITGEVVRTVYDSVTGRYPLIPYGSTIVGGYDSRVGYGQERLPTAWDWLILPNGDKMPLGAMPGADRSGVAGLPIDVDNHLFATVSRSALLTLSGATADYAMRAGMGGGSSYDFDDAFRREGGQNLDRQSHDMWGRGGNQPPTGTAESGDIFLVQVTSPLEFPHEYRGDHDFEQAD